MVRYARAASFLYVITMVASDHYDEGGDGGEPWSYLTTPIPVPLSDLTVDELGERIIITGGCDSPMGNELVVADWGEGFACMSISSKAYAFVPTRSSRDQPWSGQFVALPDMPRPRYRHASVAFADSLCVIGGRDGLDALIAEVDCYHPSTNEWTTPASLPEGQLASDLAAFAHPDVPGVGYLVGGFDESYFARDSVTVVTWSEGGTEVAYADGPVLNGKRGDVDIAVVDGYAYVSGGYTHENDYAMPKNSVERLRLTLTNATTGGTGEGWNAIDSLNQERGDKQLAGLNGRVYAIGGETQVDVTGVPESELPGLGARSEVLDTVEVYDPREDVHAGMAEWRSLAAMPGQLFRFGATEWRVEGEEDGYIFVFGGQVAYDEDCKCFRTTDKVMAFDVHHAEELHHAEEEGASSVSTIVDATRALSVAAVGALLWLAL